VTKPKFCRETTQNYSEKLYPRCNNDLDSAFRRPDCGLAISCSSPAHDRVLARTPAARWGAIGDFAGIAVFLASPAPDFVTGTVIPVDGGYSVMG
jgi:NAD(P)-dependent dehydrogenase (short-subunit alcohol dehydrogenase family)